MDTNIYEGLPTISLLPVNPVRFKVMKQVEISIPKTGVYSELELDLFSADELETAGEFNLFSENSFDMQALTKVLLAEGKYPKLNGNQLFTLSFIKVDGDCVIVNGSILDIIGIMGGTDGTEAPV